MSKKVIKVAAREKRRMVNAAVGKNFLKTVTEPLTNSDSILKKRDGVPHSAGLVDELLKLKRDQRIDTSELKKLVPKRGTSLPTSSGCTYRFNRPIGWQNCSWKRKTRSLKHLIEVTRGHAPMPAWLFRGTHMGSPACWPYQSRFWLS
jgi:hypothetical protein